MNIELQKILRIVISDNKTNLIPELFICGLLALRGDLCLKSEYFRLSNDNVAFRHINNISKFLLDVAAGTHGVSSIHPTYQRWIGQDLTNPIEKLNR